MTTTVQLSENSHRGFEGLKAALCLASMEVKSNVASGMPVCLRQNGIGSRSTGKERDAETGLDYFLARYYSGAQGRFLSPDEWKGGPDDALTGKDITPPGPLPYADIGNPQSLNKYAYTYNNPLRYTDPDGHIVDTIADIGFIGYDIYTLFKEGSTATNWIALGADVGCALLPFASGGGLAVRAGVKAEHAIEAGVDAGRALKAVERGRESEKVVLGAEGLAKNTKTITAVDTKTGKVGGTIPDAIRPTGATVEVKDVKRLSDSPQMRRQSEISRRSGQQGEVITGRNTKVSKTVQDRMQVRRREDLGPQN